MSALSNIFFDIKDPNSDATHITMFEPEKIRSINAMFDPERLNSRNLLASMAGLGGIGLSDEMLQEEPEQEFAAGGLVAKKGMKALQELLESMKVKDPERLKRAEKAGFDTSKVWLHGTNEQFDNFKIPEQNQTSFMTNDDLRKWIYLTDDPEHASEYAKQVFELKDSGAPTVIPVFTRNPQTFNDAGGETFDFAYPDILKWANKVGHNVVDINDVYDPVGDDFYEMTNTRAVSSPKAIRSIFNDFTPESLADDKFAAGGLVQYYPYE